MTSTPDVLLGKRALLLEDNFVIALELESRLGEIGLVVVGSCAHVDEARRVAAEANVDFAVLDVHVRGGSSVPLAVELEARGVRCVFISGYNAIPGLPPDLLRVPRLSKPLQPHELRRTLEALLSTP